MKRLKVVFSFLILVCFLGSTTGVSIYKHYCGDFLAATSLYFESNPCVDENGEESCSADQAHNCCDDESEFYQLELDFLKNHSEQEDKLAVVLATYLVLDKGILPAESSLIKPFNHKVPPDKNKKLYKLFNRYVYYG